MSASKVVLRNGKKETRAGCVKEETMFSNAELIMRAASIAALGAGKVTKAVEGRFLNELRVDVLGRFICTSICLHPKYLELLGQS